MAGLWEPVGGVFWSTPPAATDELWSYLPVIPVLAVAVIAGLKVWQRIKVERQQPDWKLRQHMVEIGTAITVAYLFAMLVLVCVRGSQMLTMPLNEVGDFLAGAFGPVAFLWLVLGFLQQGDELRMSTEALKDQATQLESSVQHQLALVEATKQQSEVELTKLQMEQDERDRALRAKFSIITISSGNEPRAMAMNKFRIWNEGAKATKLALTFEPQVYGAHILQLADMAPNTHAEYKFVFSPHSCAAEGTACIAYLDENGTARHQSFRYTFDMASTRFDFEKIYEAQG